MLGQAFQNVCLHVCIVAFSQAKAKTGVGEGFQQSLNNTELF